MFIGGGTLFFSSRTSIWGLIGMIALAVVLGIVVGYGTRQPRVSSLQDEVTSLHGLVLQQDAQTYEEISRLETLMERRREEAAQLKAAEVYLRQDLATIKQENEQLKVQVGRQQERLESLNVEGNTILIEAEELPSLRQLVALLSIDRLILVEMRKTIPEQRDQALYYWKNIKGLAGQSHSTLGARAGRVVNAVPSYFDWFETSFANGEEESTMYYLLGANQYADMVNEFLEEALLIVINRLDQVAQLTDGAFE